MNIRIPHSKKNNVYNISLKKKMTQSRDHYSSNLNERETKKVKNDRGDVKIKEKTVAPLINTECHEKNVSLSINDQITTAIIDQLQK